MSSLNRKYFEKLKSMPFDEFLQIIIALSSHEEYDNKIFINKVNGKEETIPIGKAVHNLQKKIILEHENIFHEHVYAISFRITDISFTKSFQNIQSIYRLSYQDIIKIMYVILNFKHFHETSQSEAINYSLKQMTHENFRASDLYLISNYMYRICNASHINPDRFKKEYKLLDISSDIYHRPILWSKLTMLICTMAQRYMVMEQATFKNIRSTNLDIYLVSRLIRMSNTINKLSDIGTETVKYGALIKDFKHRENNKLMKGIKTLEKNSETYALLYLLDELFSSDENNRISKLTSRVKKFAIANNYEILDSDKIKGQKDQIKAMLSRKMKTMDHSELIRSHMANPKLNEIATILFKKFNKCERSNLLYKII